MNTKCTICNAWLHEDGSTDQCAGECDRQTLPESSPTHELNFHEDPVSLWDHDYVFYDEYGALDDDIVEGC
jgi:hypothetical protein